MQPKVSIVIPTYNGEKKIPLLLEALKRQTFLDFELIIVIDGSTDSTREVLAEIETALPRKVIEQPNQGRAIAKNNGAAQAVGQVLIFYDDDMEPNPGSVQAHVDFHQNHFGLVSGNSIEPELNVQSDTQTYKAALTKKWMHKFKTGLNSLGQSNLFFSAANCSMLKDVFDQLGGFDKRLTDAEDFELAIRALKKNVPVYFDKSNEALHHDQITCTGYIKRLRQYNVAHQKVYSIHVDLASQRQSSPGILKKFLYSIFALAFFPKMIDRFNVFRILPKAIRYRVYDIVIHSLSRVHHKVGL